jgi:hypothetical protein
VRVALQGVGVHPHHLEQADDALLLLPAAREFVNLDSLAHDRAHPHAWVERGVGILKDELHLAAQRA